MNVTEGSWYVLKRATYQTEGEVQNLLWLPKVSCTSSSNTGPCDDGENSNSSYYSIACLNQLRQTEQFTSNHQYGLLNENIRFLRSHAKSLLYISKCLRNDFFFKSGPSEIWLDGNCDHQPQLSIHLRFSSLLESRSFISSWYTWTWPFLEGLPGKQFWIVLSPLNKSMITR